MKKTIKLTNLSGAETSKAIKYELSIAFPDIKFSVRYRSFSMGNSSDVSWYNGPTTSQVDAVVKKYAYGRFDSMEDLQYSEHTKVVTESGEIETIGGTKYVQTSRHIALKDEIENPEKYRQNEEGLQMLVAKDLAKNNGQEWKGLWATNVYGEGGRDGNASDMAHVVLSGNAFDTNDVAEYQGLKKITEIDLNIPGLIYDEKQGYVYEGEKIFHLNYPDRWVILYDGKHTTPVRIIKEINSRIAGHIANKKHEAELAAREEQHTLKIAELKLLINSPAIEDNIKHWAQTAIYNTDWEEATKDAGKFTFKRFGLIDAVVFDADFTGSKVNELATFLKWVKEAKKEGRSTTSRVRVEQILVVDAVNYALISNNLLTSLPDVWRGIGGTGVPDEIIKHQLNYNDQQLKEMEERFYKHQLLPAEQQVVDKYKATNVTLVYNEESKESFVANVSGGAYPLYVGFPVNQADVDAAMLAIDVQKPAPVGESYQQPAVDENYIDQSDALSETMVQAATDHTSKIETLRAKVEKDQNRVDLVTDMLAVKKAGGKDAKEIKMSKKQLIDRLSLVKEMLEHSQAELAEAEKDTTKFSSGGDLDNDKYALDGFIMHMRETMQGIFVRARYLGHNDFEVMINPDSTMDELTKAFDEINNSNLQIGNHKLSTISVMDGINGDKKDDFGHYVVKIHANFIDAYKKGGSFNIDTELAKFTRTNKEFKALQSKSNIAHDSRRKLEKDYHQAIQAGNYTEAEKIRSEIDQLKKEANEAHDKSMELLRAHAETFRPKLATGGDLNSYTVTVNYQSKSGKPLTKRVTVSAADDDAAIDLAYAQVKKLKNYGRIDGGDVVENHKSGGDIQNKISVRIKTKHEDRTKEFTDAAAAEQYFEDLILDYDLERAEGEEGKRLATATWDKDTYAEIKARKGASIQGTINIADLDSYTNDQLDDIYQENIGYRPIEEGGATREEVIKTLSTYPYELKMAKGGDMGCGCDHSDDTEEMRQGGNFTPVKTTVIYTFNHPSLGFQNSITFDGYLTEAEAFEKAKAAIIQTYGANQAKRFTYKLAPQPTKNVSADHIMQSGGAMQSGIINQYAGKTPEQVWRAWDDGQRYHFMNDHSEVIDDFSINMVLKYMEQPNFTKLPAGLKLAVEQHVNSGQYGKGGWFSRFFDNKKEKHSKKEWLVTATATDGSGRSMRFDENNTAGAEGAKNDFKKLNYTNIKSELVDYLYKDGGDLPAEKNANGDIEVPESRYDYMLQVMPPKYFNTVSGLEVKGGFAVGEAYNHANTKHGVRATYTAFYQQGDKYYEIPERVYFVSQGEAMRVEPDTEFKYKDGGDFTNEIKYYAVGNENTLGYVFDGSSGKEMFGILHASPLKGSSFNWMSGPLFVDQLETIRAANEKDFDEYRVSLPPDFYEKNQKWTPDQRKQVNELDADFEQALKEKGINPNSKERADFWRSGGYKTRFMNIFGKTKLEQSGDLTQIWLSIDGGKPVTFDQFYAENTEPDVEAPTAEEFEKVRNLKLGQYIYIGTTKVKRVLPNDPGYKTPNLMAAGGPLSKHVYEKDGYKSWSTEFINKGNHWRVGFTWGKANYIWVRKITNNPHGLLGKEFKNIDEAIAHYKDANIRAQLVFAEDEAKKKGYVPQMASGGDLNDHDLNLGGPLTSMVPAAFSIPGSDPEHDYFTYKGIHNPNDTWNGFANPYFDKETCLKVLTDCDYTYRMDGDKIIVDLPDYPGEQDIIEPVEIEGYGKMYPFGMGWTWEVEDETKEPSVSENNIADIGQIEKLAVEFSTIIKRDLTKKQLKDVIAKNKTPQYNSACATHDYIDSNMSMDEAFKKVTGREITFFDDEKPETEKQNEADMALINSAWALAKTKEFYTKKLQSGGPISATTANSNAPHPGLYIGPSHEQNGIPVVIDEVKPVEVEGREYHICHAVINNPEVLSYQGQTALQILDDLFTRSNCEFEQGKANSGDFIVCKLVVNDPTKHTLNGTARQIIDELQAQKHCNVSNAPEPGSGSEPVTEAPPTLQKGGSTNWFKEAIYNKKPYNLGGWHASDNAENRRKHALESRPGTWPDRRKQLSAGRALQALANVTQDEITKNTAKADADYFFSLSKKPKKQKAAQDDSKPVKIQNLFIRYKTGVDVNATVEFTAVNKTAFQNRIERIKKDTGMQPMSTPAFTGLSTKTYHMLLEGRFTKYSKLKTAIAKVTKHAWVNGKNTGFTAAGVTVYKDGGLCVVTRGQK